MQLGVEQKVNQRRASLVSQLYSEGPVIGKGGGGDAAGNKSQQQQSATNLGASGGGGSGGGGNNIVIPKVRPPPPGVMRRQVPQGKFGLLGMGKPPNFFTKITEDIT